MGAKNHRSGIHPDRDLFLLHLRFQCFDYLIRAVLQSQSGHERTYFKDSNTAGLAIGYAQSIVTDFNQTELARHNEVPPSTILLDRAWFNPNLDSQWFIVPGICGVLTLLVSLLTTGLSVAREREMGTFDQLLVTPMKPTEILAGKAS